MTHTLTLTHDEENKLRRAARKRGQEADALVREAVLQMLSHDEDATEDDLPAPGESLAEALQGYIGVVDSKGQYNFSEDTGRHFADGLVEKRRQGRL